MDVEEARRGEEVGKARKFYLWFAQHKVYMLGSSYTVPVNISSQMATFGTSMVQTIAPHVYGTPNTMLLNRGRPQKSTGTSEPHRLCL